MSPPLLAVRSTPPYVLPEHNTRTTLLSYAQEHYRILGRDAGGNLRTETSARKSGTILQDIQNDYDEQRHAINFMIAKSQLSDFTPQSRYERVETRYRVKSLSLTFTVDVWQRDAKEYEGRKVTHTMEGLDVEWQR